MSFSRSDMLYEDGKYYTWNAKSSNDDPKTIGGKEKDELNRREGYEVLPFIQSWVTFHFTRPTKSVYWKVERMIRYHVPEDLQDRGEIAQWIYNNYNSTK